MEFKRLVATPVIIAGLVASQAHAAVDIAGAKLRGFMSAAGSYSGYEGTVDGFSKGLSFTRDTRLGLNIAANFSDDWSFAGQLLGRGYLNNWRVTADWLFATWRPTDNFWLRGGRSIFASWMYSDQIDVGFNYIWIRPPSEVYGLNPLKSFNGISGGYTFNLPASVDLSIEAFGGDSDFAVDTAGASLNAAAKNLVGAVISAQNDFMLVRAMASTSQVSINGSAQVSNASVYGPASAGAAAAATQVGQAAAAAAGAGNATLAAQLGAQAQALGVAAASYGALAAIPGSVTIPLNFAEERINFYSLGARFDKYNVFAVTEIARLLSNGANFKRRDGAYGTLGYRVWRLTPHVTYAWGGNGQGTLTTGEAKSWVFGLNYKVNDSAVLKAEYKRVTNLSDQAGGGLGFANNLAKDQTESVVTASLDLVF